MSEIWSTAGGVGQKFRPLERREVSGGERGADERLTTVLGEAAVLLVHRVNLRVPWRFLVRFSGRCRLQRNQGKMHIVRRGC